MTGSKEVSQRWNSFKLASGIGIGVQGEWQSRLRAVVAVLRTLPGKVFAACSYEYEAMQSFTSALIGSDNSRC